MGDMFFFWPLNIAVMLWCSGGRRCCQPVRCTTSNGSSRESLTATGWDVFEVKKSPQWSTIFTIFKKGSTLFFFCRIFQISFVQQFIHGYILPRKLFYFPRAAGVGPTSCLLCVSCVLSCVSCFSALVILQVGLPVWGSLLERKNYCK